MKNIEFNESSLSLEEVDKVVKKVRAFVVNANTGQMLLVHYAGLYMLPGGSIDEGEKELSSLEREILEEAGITINRELAIPFLKIDSYDKNYFDRKSGVINRLTETTFFEVSTTDDIDETMKKLTESEKDNNHQIFFVDLEMVKTLVEENDTDNKKKEQFDRELLTALDEYLKFRQRRITDTEDIKKLKKCN